MAAARFQIYTDAAGKFRWRLKDGNGEKIAASAESFDNRSDARRAAQSVKETAGGARIED